MLAACRWSCGELPHRHGQQGVSLAVSHKYPSRIVLPGGGRVEPIMVQGSSSCGVRTVALLAAMAAAVSADAPGWVGSGEVRFQVARDKDSPAAATVGWARIYPPTAAAHPDVAVATDAGAVVGSHVLWSTPGAPIDLLFDCHAGAASYQVYLGAKLPGSQRFEPQAGVVLETRHRPGAAFDTWTAFQEAWRASANEVMGRSLVPNVFDGFHRHGPSVDYMSSYHGCFQVAKAGEYVFATVSDDGSFVFIDEKPVCAWPGTHGVDGGQRGQHQGPITLSPGRHVLDYYHFQGAGDTYAELAWRPPGADRLEVMPASAFLPVARFAAKSAERRGAPQPAAFAWEMAGHTMLGGEGGGPALVDVHLRLIDKANLGARWVFDDGSTAEGVEVEHCFPRTGLRTVRLEVGQGGHPVGTLSQEILVHPQWLQAEDFPDHRWQTQRKDLLERSFPSMPESDLAALVLFARGVPDLEMLSRLGAAVLTRAREFTGGDAAALLALGFHFQHQDVRQYQAARDCLSACTLAAKAAPELVASAHLHLGGLLLHAFFDVEQSRAQLDAVQADKLSGDDQRLLKMYQGDALLASGNVEGARQRYLAAGTAAAPGDLRYALLRRTRIETARKYIRQGDYDAAEETVRSIEWETPIERMGTETGLLLAAVWTARKELPFALSACRLMLIAAPDDARRPEVLLAQVQAHLAAGHLAEASAIARQLISDHPYSEAAARVKDLVVVSQGAPR